MHCYKNFFNVLVNVNVPSNELHNAFFFFYIHFYFQCKHISLLTLCCPIDIFKVTTQIYKYTPSHGLRTVQWTFWVFPPTPGFLHAAWDFCRGGLSSAVESLWWWTIERRIRKSRCASQFVKLQDPKCGCIKFLPFNTIKYLEEWPSSMNYFWN